MSEKPCACCKEVKPLDSFCPNARMKLGVDSYCKACRAANAKKKRESLREKTKVIPATKLCGGCREVKGAESFCVERCRPDGLSRICRACRSAKHFASYAKDPEAYRAKARECGARRKGNESFVVHKRVSSRVGEWLGSKKGGKRTFDLLGYTLPELKAHLERQFVKGMSWGNMGKWHIDHIVPLSAFSVAGPDDPELRRAWALPNLRPLWAAENIAKKDKRVTLL